MTRPVGDMSYSLYKKIIDEVTQYGVTNFLTLHYSGEPLLHPQIYDMITYAKEQGIRLVKFNTNGLLLDYNAIEQLLGSGLDIIVIAIEATKKIHDTLRKGSDYGMVRMNVASLMYFKKLLKKKKPVVIVQMLVTNETSQEDINLGIQTWKPIVDYVQVQSISTVGGQVNNYGSFREKQTRCRQVWTTAGILWNGDVTVCCVDHNAQLKQGNLNEQSLYSIWNSKRYRNFREIHRDNHPPEFCRRCLNDILPPSKDGGF
jgi:radical SAM protein with 4Fe4S-binding SPASM domain